MKTGQVVTAQHTLANLYLPLIRKVGSDDVSFGIAPIEEGSAAEQQTVNRLHVARGLFEELGLFQVGVEARL